MVLGMAPQVLFRETIFIDYLVAFSKNYAIMPG